MKNNLQNLIRFDELKQRIGLCRSRVYQLMDEDKFPQSIKISDRAIAWLESDINQWINERVESSKEAING